MTFWEILMVIAIILIPLALSIWMTLWTVEKRGRGPKPIPPAEANRARTDNKVPAEPPAGQE